MQEKEWTTIGGYVFGELGRLPRPGDRVTAEEIVLEVASMDGRRVDQLRIISAPTPKEEPAS